MDREEMMRTLEQQAAPAVQDGPGDELCAMQASQVSGNPTPAAAAVGHCVDAAPARPVAGPVSDVMLDLEVGR